MAHIGKTSHIKLWTDLAVFIYYITCGSKASGYNLGKCEDVPRLYRRWASSYALCEYNLSLSVALLHNALATPHDGASPLLKKGGFHIMLLYRVMKLGNFLPNITRSIFILSMRLQWKV